MAVSRDWRVRVAVTTGDRGHWFVPFAWANSAKEYA